MTEPTLGIVSELLAGAPPWGAYSMGVATAAFLRYHVQPPRELLDKARACTCEEDYNALLQVANDLLAERGLKSCT